MVKVLRVTGHSLTIVGHFVLLYVSLVWGLALCVVANTMILPWAVRDKLWDVVIIMSFFFVIEGTKLLSLVFF